MFILCGAAGLKSAENTCRENSSAIVLWFSVGLFYLVDGGGRIGSKPHYNFSVEKRLRAHFPH